MNEVRQNGLVFVLKPIRSAIMLFFWLLPASCCCKNGMVVNPFRDELAAQPPVSTPSADAVREASKAAPAKTEVRRRGHEPLTATVADGSVTHPPLYYREWSGGSDDPRQPYCWDGEDYLRLCTGPARFLFDTITFPIHAVILPPCAAVVSDGIAPQCVDTDPPDAQVRGCACGYATADS